jgi:hypothetical protein
MLRKELQYISAQPDEIYFYWQLGIQIHNFLKCGIEGKNINILIGYKDHISKAGFKFHAIYNNIVRLYFYKDERIDKTYQPSIRPHILRKHFRNYPDLKNEVFFYHDCDIIFIKKVDFSHLIEDDVIYTSDCNSYLNADYLISKGLGTIERMCRVVGIENKQVLEINSNSGGAQVILKNIDHIFWAKIERDCTSLYKILEELKISFTDYHKKLGNEYNPVQSWCADMWAMLYNLILFKKKHQIHRDLDFCFATDYVINLKNKFIIHNAGVMDENKDYLFYKSDPDFKKIFPFNQDYSYVDSMFCSSLYVKELLEFESSEIFFIFDKIATCLQ